MIICTKNLRAASNHHGEKFANAFLKELFRLTARQFHRAFGGEFRMTHKGRPRTYLPIVSAPKLDGYGSRYPSLEYRPMVSTPLDRV